MISGGGGIFSVADLNGPSATLYAKIKIKGKEIECICEFDHGDGITDVRLKSGEVIEVKTDKLYDYNRTNEVPLNWR